MSAQQLKLALALCAVMSAGASFATDVKGTATVIGNATGTATAAASTLRVSGQGAAAEVDMELRGRIVEIGPDFKVAVISMPDGHLISVGAGPKMKSFKSLRIGDEVVVQAMMGLAVSIDVSGGSGIRERAETRLENGQARGAAPFKTTGREVQMVGTVERWDPASREVTIRGAVRCVSLKVPPKLNVDQVREGVEVRAIFTEAVALGVVPAKP